jgi:hypothetical protein
VAVTDGDYDSLICLLPKLGIDLAETGVMGQDRSFTFYSWADRAPPGQGTELNMPGITEPPTLWRSLEQLQKYDMVINSCQGDEMKKEKGTAGFAAVTQYLNAGGRMFNTHYSYDFL